ncbi:MAG: hypothetical protein MUF72_16195 [Elainella sp. Prado103]|nr:hypothetical protein [Elainella sp. Prado103]
MKRIQKLAAGAMLGLGLLVVLFHSAELISPEVDEDDKEEAIPNLVIVGLPLTAIGSWLFWQGHRQHQTQLQLQLRQAFFQLLQHNHGQVTPLQLAMATGLDGTAAKAYLNQWAQEFDADYHITAEGDLIYHFALTQAEMIGSRATDPGENS